MSKSPTNDDALNRRARTLQALCARRAAMDAQIALDEARNPHAAVKLKPWFVHTDRGMRHFPASPKNRSREFLTAPAAGGRPVTPTKNTSGGKP